MLSSSPSKLENEESTSFSRIVIGLAVVSLLVIGALISNNYQTQDISKSVELEWNSVVNDVSSDGFGVRGDIIKVLPQPVGNGNRGIRYGASVATLGNLAVVGAPKAAPTQDAAGNKLFKGAVFVYKRGSLVQTLEVSSGYEFGFKVALERQGGRIYLAASSLQEDAVHVFKLVNGQFVRVQTVKPKDQLNWTGYGSSFGTSVTMCGKYLVVGARHETVNGLYYFGGAYIYTFNAYAKKFVFMQRILSKFGPGHFDVATSMSKSRPGMLVVGSMAAFGQVRIMKLIRGRFRVVKILRKRMRVFGSSISLEKNYLAVGAYLPQLNEAGINNPGYVFIYKEVSPNKWVQIKRLTKGRKGLGFGSSVKLTKNGILVVGAKRAKCTRNGGRRGAVFGYKIRGNRVKSLGRICSPRGGKLGFGKSVDVSGRSLIVGGYGKRNRGIAVIYN